MPSTTPHRRQVSHRSRPSSRRFASSISLGIIAVGVLSALVAVANRWSDREGLASVVVRGNHVLSASEILKQAELPDSITVEKLDLSQVERRIADHPFIEGAVIYDGGKGALIVEIDERSPVGVTVLDGEPVYVDVNGVELPFRFGATAADVPVISGTMRRGVRGDALDSIALREAIGVVESIRMHDETLYRRIAEVRRGRGGSYTLLLTDGGLPVTIGTADEIVPRLAKLAIFIERVLTVEGTDQIRAIDLRWTDQVVVRWVTKSVAQPKTAS